MLKFYKSTCSNIQQMNTEKLNKYKNYCQRNKKFFIFVYFIACFSLYDVQSINIILKNSRLVYKYYFKHSFFY